MRKHASQWGFSGLPSSPAEPVRRQKSGSIINIASVAGGTALPNRVIYSTAQAGKMMFTKALACEWAQHGIRVNCIAPGTILTDLVRRNFELGLLDGGKVLERTPMGRFGETSEIASTAVFFLACRRARRMSPVRFSSWTAAGHPGADGRSPLTGRERVARETGQLRRATCRTMADPRSHAAVEHGHVPGSCQHLHSRAPHH